MNSFKKFFDGEEENISGTKFEKVTTFGKIINLNMKYPEVHFYIMKNNAFSII